MHTKCKNHGMCFLRIVVSFLLLNLAVQKGMTDQRVSLFMDLLAPNLILQGTSLPIYEFSLNLNFGFQCFLRFHIYVFWKLIKS